MKKSILEMLPQGSYKLDRIIYDNKKDNVVHHTIITLEINADITVFIHVEADEATIFFNDVELVIRLNEFAIRVFEKLRDANLRYQIFLLQLLKHLEIEQPAAI